MAANKLHLKNVDKDYKLKKTDKVTSAGRPVYINTKTGEEHSEISVTLEMPEGSGNWINVPSLINGRVYNLQGVIDMLRAGKIEPNSTGHATQEVAVEAAKARSASLQPNIGQTLKAADNAALAERGISTDSSGIRRDAIGRIIEYQPSGPHVGEPTPVIVDDMGAAMSDQMNQELASTYPTEEENPNGLFVRNKPGSRAGSSTNTIAQVNPDKHHISRDRNKLKELAAIMDRANAEKEDEFYDPTKPRTNVWGDNNPRYWDGWFKGVGGYKARQNDPAFSQMTISPEDQAIFDQARKQRLLDDEKKTIGIPGYGATNQGTVSAADQAMFDAAKREREIGRAMSSYGPRFTPEMDTGTRTKPSKSKIFNFEYKPHMTPEQKINDNRSLKGLTPEYGEMPGFKKAKDGNYWSADETSPFWQTDAGYEKAMQTWGEKPGWVKPNYRPKKQELDIDAIKKWFKPNK